MFTVKVIERKKAFFGDKDIVHSSVSGLNSRAAANELASIIDQTMPPCRGVVFVDKPMLGIVT